MPRWAEFWQAPLRGAEYHQVVTLDPVGCRNGENEISVTVIPWCRIDRKSTVIRVQSMIVTRVVHVETTLKRTKHYKFLYLTVHRLDFCYKRDV